MNLAPVSGRRHTIYPSYVLAIHAVSHAAVPGDRVTKVFDVESSLEARSEEPAEGRDKRCECSHREDVQLEGCVRDRGRFSTELHCQRQRRGGAV